MKFELSIYFFICLTCFPVHHCVRKHEFESLNGDLKNVSSYFEMNSYLKYSVHPASLISSSENYDSVTGEKSTTKMIFSRLRLQGKERYLERDIENVSLFNKTKQVLLIINRSKKEGQSTTSITSSSTTLKNKQLSSVNIIEDPITRTHHINVLNPHVSAFNTRGSAHSTVLRDPQRPKRNHSGDSRVENKRKYSKNSMERRKHSGKSMGGCSCWERHDEIRASEKVCHCKKVSKIPLDIISGVKIL